tara:strand:+ start:248 stop:829 length:582 start_codon:yes stop_codon:yes gene_type:complete
VEKLIGNKTKIAVFISGRGSNLNSLIKNSRSKNSFFKIQLVISNNKNAKGLNYAKKYKIKFYVIKYYNLKLAEKKTLNLLKKFSVDVICLAGFMKILSKNFIKKFNKPILNIHPSLLPKYKGLNTHYRVLKNKDKYSGSTVHLVTQKLDSGKIILQKKIKLSKLENIKSLEQKILKVEHKIYSAAVNKFLSNL